MLQDRLSKYYSFIISYVSLMKPRITCLVAFTYFIGLSIAPGYLNYYSKIIGIISVILGSGAAGSINMWYDRDIDKLMKRTQGRPVVKGIIKPINALFFGIFLCCISIILMICYVNLFSGLLLLTAILYYIFVYTIWLKRSSYKSVEIGGVSGALTPIIGWVSVTNSISLEPIILSVIIFTWTPTHSWAMALYNIEDYTNVNLPILPLIKGSLYTRRQIMVYSIITFFVSLIPFFLKSSNLLYLIIAIVSGIALIYLSRILLLRYSQNAARKLFIFSIFYLFTIFLSLGLFDENLV